MQMFLLSSSSAELPVLFGHVRKHVAHSFVVIDSPNISGPGLEFAPSSTTNEINHEQRTIEIYFWQTITGCKRIRRSSTRARSV